MNIIIIQKRFFFPAILQCLKHTDPSQTHSSFRREVGRRLSGSRTKPKPQNKPQGSKKRNQKEDDDQGLPEQDGDKGNSKSNADSEKRDEVGSDEDINQTDDEFDGMNISHLSESAFV